MPRMFIPEKNSVIRRAASRIAMRLLSTRLLEKSRRSEGWKGLCFIFSMKIPRAVENAAAGKCVHIKIAMYILRANRQLRFRRLE